MKDFDTFTKIVLECGQFGLVTLFLSTYLVTPAINLFVIFFQNTNNLSPLGTK